MVRLRFGTALVLGAALACQPLATAPTVAPSASALTCAADAQIVGAFVYQGSLGVQNGIELRLRAGTTPTKVMWANRSEHPPMTMTIRAVSKTDGTQDITFQAGWAATPAQLTFPPQGPVTGYVSEIPTLAVGGCWDFSWVQGAPADRISLRAGAR